MRAMTLTSRMAGIAPPLVKHIVELAKELYKHGFTFDPCPHCGLPHMAKHECYLYTDPNTETNMVWKQWNRTKVGGITAKQSWAARITSSATEAKEAEGE